MSEMTESSPGKLVIISGPSGAGKSTVVQKLLDNCDLPLQLSVSATTRKPRDGEQDGVNYHFLSQQEFAQKREDNQFLECMEVFGHGDWYGTFRNDVTTGLKGGKWVILEIDVDGTLSVIKEQPDAITIFVHPGSIEELERRLQSRGTDTQQSILRRLEVARRELAAVDRYKHEVINDEVGRAVQEICEILKQIGD